MNTQNNSKIKIKENKNVIQHISIDTIKYILDLSKVQNNNNLLNIYRLMFMKTKFKKF